MLSRLLIKPERYIKAYQQQHIITVWTMVAVLSESMSFEVAKDFFSLHPSGIKLDHLG